MAGYLHVLGAKEVKFSGVLSCSFWYTVVTTTIIIIIIIIIIIAVDVLLFDGRQKLANGRHREDGE